MHNPSPFGLGFSKPPTKDSREPFDGLRVHGSPFDKLRVNGECGCRQQTFPFGLSLSKPLPMSSHDKPDKLRGHG